MTGPAGIEEVCSECGARRRVIESLPKQPLRVSKARELGSRPQIGGVHPVMAVRGSAIGFPTEAEITRQIALATAEKTHVVGYYAGTGWVIEHSFEHGEGESPEEAAERVGEEFSESLAEDTAEAMSDLLGDSVIHEEDLDLEDIVGTGQP